MIREKRKGDVSMIMTFVIVLIIGILIITIFLPMFSHLANSVANGACKITYGILSAFYSIVSSEPMANFC